MDLFSFLASLQIVAVQICRESFLVHAPLFPFFRLKCWGKSELGKTSCPVKTKLLRTLCVLYYVAAIAKLILENFAKFSANGTCVFSPSTLKFLDIQRCRGLRTISEAHLFLFYCQLLGLILKFV